MKGLTGLLASLRFDGNSLAITKVVVAMALIALASIANALQLTLVRHNQTSSGGVVSTLITDGADGNPATNAIFDWNGTTLISTGLYSATSHLSSNPLAPSILGDRITDLAIDTSTGSASATAYACVEGTFLAGVGANGCGGYTLGLNFVDESTTVWTGTTVSQTIGGDDVSTGAPRTIAAYDFGTVATFEADGVTPSSGTTPGDLIEIGNGIDVGVPDGEALIFELQTSADDDAANGASNVAIGIPVLANDAVADSIDTLTTANFSAGGTAVVSGVPGPRAGVSIDYTSAPGFAGVETFEYTVTDANGPAVTATVSVTVTDQPVAGDDGTPAAPFATVEAGTTVTLDVLANDFGLGNTPLTVLAPVNTNPALGIATVTGSPGDAAAIRIEYAAGQVAGADQFGYQVSDNGGQMDDATVFVEVIVPSVPVAVDDSATTFIDEATRVDVLANDMNLDDAPLAVTITSDPASGSIGAITDCTRPGGPCAVEYTPQPGFAGTDTFQYTVTDSTPEVSNAATVTITVNAVPVAIDDTRSTSSAIPVAIDVLANDAGLVFPPFTVDVLPLASFRGTAATQADNTILFTPSGGAEREDVFDYQVTDANGKSSIARVRVTISPSQTSLAGPASSSAVGPLGAVLLGWLAWFRRRR